MIGINLFSSITEVPLEIQRCLNGVTYAKEILLSQRNNYK